MVKYDASGNALWAKTIIAGPSYSSFSAVAVVSDGSVYAAGYQSGTGSFDYGGASTPISGTTSTNPVLLKYDASGNALWAKTISASTDNAQFQSVAVATDGSVFAAGYQSGTGSHNYGGASAPISGAATTINPLLVKYDASGNALWAKTIIASTDSASFSDVAVATDGSVFAAGDQSGTGSFDYGGASAPISGTYAGGLNPLLVKYDASGSGVWAKTIIAGTDLARFNAVTVAPNNSVYAAGHQGAGSFDYGGASTPISGTASIYNPVLVKYMR